MPAGYTPSRTTRRTKDALKPRPRPGRRIISDERRGRTPIVTFKGVAIPGLQRRSKVILFFETFETAAIVRRVLGEESDVVALSDLATLKIAMRGHGPVDAVVAEYGGVAHAPLVALRAAERSQLIPRRILLTRRGVTAGVLDVVREHAATSLVFLPRCGEALRSAVLAPVAEQCLRTRSAA